MPETTRLGPLISVERARVPQLGWQRALVDPVLEDSSHNRCGAFRTQGQVVITLSREGVHLFGNNIG